MKIRNNKGEEITLEFADDFFDTFPGIPEELQEVMDSLVEMIKDGSLFENSEPLSIEDLDEDEADAIMQAMESHSRKHTLQ